MATLKRKITARKGHRNHAEKLLNDIDQNLDDRVKIKSLINSFTKKHSLIKQLDNEILELIKSENDIEKEIESTSEFSDKLQIAFGKLENILSEQKNKKKSSTITTASLVTNNKPESSRVRLPKLKIPKFSGNALQWKSFWDQYNATIHSSTVISNIKKFNFFKNLLTGSALESISSLSLTDSNYERAIDLLKERFNNPQILISSCMKVLATLPKVHSMKHVAELRDLYNKIENSVTSLKDCAVPTDTVIY